MFTTSIETTMGQFTATYSEQGLTRLDFPASRSAPPTRTPLPARVETWHRRATRAVRDVVAGRTPRALPPLDLRGGTDFQRRVWDALLRIPAGRTRSYGEIAAAVKHPKAARAVGSACGANPVPLLVPCHRVLAAGGGLGGFSGGLDWKRRLLALESAS